MSALFQPKQRKEATYADILALPPGVNGQIIDGELYASPRPASPHARSSSILGGDLTTSFDRNRGGPGGWWILDEPELHFGKQILIPDLGGWRRSRMPVFPKVAFFTLAPDWICEVLSPSTSSLDRIKKMRVYAQQEVAYAWLIDPEARTLEVFRLNEAKQWVLIDAFEGDVNIRAEPFDAVELELGALWLPPEETPAAPEVNDASNG